MSSKKIRHGLRRHSRLERFWREGVALKEVPPLMMILYPTGMFRIFPWWKPWTKAVPRWAPYAKQAILQDGENIDTNDFASEETTRRYYSTKEFVFLGNRVFSIKDLRPDKKFLDEGDLAKWVVLNDTPLRQQIEIFGSFPIETRFDKGQPRLLITAIDIAEGIPVTFDSYKKLGGKRKTVYYPTTKYGYRKEKEYETNDNDSKPIVIEYDDGIAIEHVMASSALPDFYDPKVIGGRMFWDGGLLSNTPLRELIQSHREYWVNVEKDIAPDLDVYIVNVHPSTISIDDIPKHYDEVKDRRDDIIYGDRTYNDQYAAQLCSDYVEFINSLQDFAINHIKEDKDKIVFQKDFKNLKAELAKCTSYTFGEHRKYEDLIRGRFKLMKVERIERKHDPETNRPLKTGDITALTIEKLIEEGEGAAELASIS